MKATRFRMEQNELYNIHKANPTEGVVTERSSHDAVKETRFRMEQNELYNIHQANPTEGVV